MLTISPVKRSRSESQMDSSDPRNSRPACKVIFEPARAATSTKDGKDIETYLIPRALLDISNEQQALMSLSSDHIGSPSTSSRAAAERMLHDGPNQIEKRIEVIARQSHCHGSHEMQTNTAIDQSAKMLKLVDQLLMLATHGYSQRALTEGNIRPPRGSELTLFPIDLGHMRKDLSQRENSSLWDAEALIDRATNDTRSANPLFLPTCCLKVKAAINLCNAAIRVASTDFQRALDRDAGYRAGLIEVSACLGDLRNAMQRLVTYRHRSIDDLESAMYLHFWRMAKYCGLRGREQNELSTLLELGPKKEELWSTRSTWAWALAKYCAQASREWGDLMRGLWSTIHEARANLDHFLWTKFENQANLSLDCLEVELLMLPWNDGSDVKRNLCGLFENKGLLEETELTQIEVDCFRKCSELLGKAGIARKALAF